MGIVMSYCVLILLFCPVLTYGQRFMSGLRVPPPPKKELQCVQSSGGPLSGYNVTMRPHNFPSTCPCVYDYSGSACASQPHMCSATRQSQVCILHIHNSWDHISTSNVVTKRRVYITEGGALLSNEGALYTFSHETMSGFRDYSPVLNRIFHQNYEEVYHGFKSKSGATGGILQTVSRLPLYDIVIPTRMRWDDCFNHISFQAVVSIAHAFEFLSSDFSNGNTKGDAIYPKIDEQTNLLDLHMIHGNGGKQFKDVYWHCHNYTAALLLLVGVPEDRIIVQRSVAANHIYLPWVGGWLPYFTSSFRGITETVSKKITSKLLKQYEASHPTVAATDAIDANKRYIVYLTRPKASHNTRHVINEAEIISMLVNCVDRTAYKVVTLVHQKESNTIDGIHATWARTAKLLSKAYLIIGPHGAAFNNMLFAPDDIQIIEFNENIAKTKTEKEAHGGTPVRPTYLNALHMHSRNENARYWIMEPIFKHFRNVYLGRLKMDTIKIFKVLLQIDKMNGHQVGTPGGSNPFAKKKAIVKKGFHESSIKKGVGFQNRTEKFQCHEYYCEFM